MAERSPSAPRQEVGATSIDLDDLEVADPTPSR